jgi:hypothetical protein
VLFPDPFGPANIRNRGCELIYLIEIFEPFITDTGGDNFFKNFRVPSPETS